VDTAAYAEGVIPPYYDSLIAKLIVRGKDRGRSDFAHVARAGDVHRRRDIYDDSAAPEDSGRSGFPRREVRYGIYRAIPDEEWERKEVLASVISGPSNFTHRGCHPASRPR
jgi:hypothetical protein